jgi:tetratricopeptide (TPR) repeat protein
MRLRTALALLLTVLLVEHASASEESQALGARAAIEIAAGRVTEGLALLDRAVAADPYDATVRYQRGVQRAKRRELDAAIEDLRAAVAYRPEFSEAELELGAALVEAGDYRGAIASLEKARRLDTLEAQASFFLGVAQLRLNRLDEAEQSFARAAARDVSLALATSYYRGVIDYRRGDLEAADARFREVERTNPDSALGQESSRFLALIRNTRRSAYQAFARVAFEYDSNVALAPDVSTTEEISKEGDGRFVLNAGGSYVPWRAKLVRLALSYEFFQSLHFNLNEFNLQDHRPALQLLFERGQLAGGLLGRYDYYLRSTDSFLQEATASPWLSYREDGFGRTDVYYRMQWRDYKDPGFDVLEGFYHETGARQFVDIGTPTRQIWCGYQFEANEPAGNGTDEFQYDAHQLEIGLHVLLPYALTMDTGYRYAHKDYNPVSGFRRDHDHRVVAALERPLSEISERLFVTVAYFATFNISNIDDFDYDRHIGSVGVEVRL